MSAQNEPKLSLDELESRQDEVLRRLDELNLSLEKVLAEWMGRLRKADAEAQSRRPAA